MLLFALGYIELVPASPWDIVVSQVVTFVYFSFAWLPLIFIAYSIGRRRVTTRSLLVLTAAEAATICLAKALYAATQFLAPMTRPRRRWFRFSLRTLFVVVTALACWLAWELSIVHERQREQRALQAKGGTFQYGWVNHGWGQAGPSPEQIEARRRCRVSTIRQWMGDRAVGYIELPWKHYEPDKARIAAIFPEAEIELFHPERH